MAIRLSSFLGFTINYNIQVWSLPDSPPDKMCQPWSENIPRDLELGLSSEGDEMEENYNSVQIYNDRLAS